MSKKSVRNACPQCGCRIRLFGGKKEKLVVRRDVHRKEHFFCPHCGVELCFLRPLNLLMAQLVVGTALLLANFGNLWRNSGLLPAPPRSLVIALLLVAFGTFAYWVSMFAFPLYVLADEAEKKMPKNSAGRQR